MSNRGKIPRITVEDVGTYWTRQDGSLWRVISFAEHPTVSWERLDGPLIQRDAVRERRGGVVGSLITEGFERLVRESEASSE